MSEEPGEGWMGATEALALLGTRPQTLYANVSRGRIKARPDPADPRRSLYARADIERLTRRRRAGSGSPARRAMDWGAPVMTTRISTVIDGRLVYRGVDAIDLAEHATLEDAAALLWETESVTLSSRAAAARSVPGALLALAGMAGDAPPTPGRSGGMLRSEAGRVLGCVLGALAGGGEDFAHERLARAFGRPDAAGPLRAALVMLAEHELNASSFATRVAASTGASLPAAVLAGFATMTGPLHGAAGVAVARLLADAWRIGPHRAIRERLAEGQVLPGFGHRLYPKGDPRAAALLADLEIPAVHTALAAAAFETTGERPNVDFALAVLCSVEALPEAAPLTIFALARTVGWLAHAIEQAETGSLIRPRAAYDA